MPYNYHTVFLFLKKEPLDEETEQMINVFVWLLCGAASTQAGRQRPGWHQHRHLTQQRGPLLGACVSAWQTSSPGAIKHISFGSSC